MGTERSRREQLQARKGLETYRVWGRRVTDQKGSLSEILVGFLHPASEFISFVSSG